jgi:hypothetical protein
MIALVLLLRYSLLLLGFGRSPFCKRKRDERERESKGGESFFFGCDYDVSLFVCSFFLFLFLFVLVFCLEQGERPEKRRVAVAAAKKMVGGENFMRNLNESSYVLC